MVDGHLFALPSAGLSLREYARHRGVSSTAVWRAIRSGRIPEACLVRDSAGKPKILDVAGADAALDRNTDLSTAPAYVKERATTPLPPAPPLPAELLNQEPTRQPLPAEPAPSPPEGADDEQDGELRIHGGMSLTEASAAEKIARAKLADLQYREKVGELVNARDVEARLGAVLAVVRTKLLGVPGKARATIPHLALPDVATIEALIREALEELSVVEPKSDAPPSSGAAA